MQIRVQFKQPQNIQFNTSTSFQHRSLRKGTLVQQLYTKPCGTRQYNSSESESEHEDEDYHRTERFLLSTQLKKQKNKTQDAGLDAALANTVYPTHLAINLDEISAMQSQLLETNIDKTFRKLAKHYRVHCHCRLTSVTPNLFCCMDTKAKT